MRNFEILYKEAQFYIEMDRKIGGDTLSHWFASLPDDEKKILKDGISEVVNRIVISFDGWAEEFFKALKLGVRDESRPNL